MGDGNVARYHTANSPGSSVVGGVAHVAIQHWLGLLPKRWSGSGSSRSAGLGRYRTPLTSYDGSRRFRTPARGGERLHAFLSAGTPRAGEVSERVCAPASRSGGRLPARENAVLFAAQAVVHEEFLELTLESLAEIVNPFNVSIAMVAIFGCQTRHVCAGAVVTFQAIGERV